MEYRVKEVFAVETTHKEFYTGGLVKVSNDCKTLFSQCSNHVTIVDIDGVSIEHTIPPNFKEFNSFEDEDIIEDPVLTFTLSLDEELITTGHKSGLIKLWKWQTDKLITSWKCDHKGPITILSFNSNRSYLTSGSTDCFLRVWNIDNRNCEYKLSGLSGVTSVLKYQFIFEKEYLFASGDESVIHGWYLEEAQKPKLEFKFPGHFSRITELLFSGNYMISCSRDKAVILWDLKTKKQVKTIPMYESLETGALLPECIHLPGYEKPITGLLVAFGGEKGKIRIWDILAGKELFVYGSDSELNAAILYLEYSESNGGLVDIRSNQNISIFNVDSQFSCRKQMIGFLDEIFDIAFFGENEEYLAVAANSCDIHVFDKNTNCSLVKGHSDIVVSLATNRSLPNTLVSGSKDNSVRVWLMKDGIVNCVAVGTRHTASVGSVSLSSSQNSFAVSVSEDTTLKLWMLPVLKYKTCASLMVSKTEIAHEKPINSVCISPKGHLIATGSQDKTSKIWSASDLSVLAVLRGHRRAIWTVKFSPIDQVLLTSSADTTLRLWSLTDYSCLKTLEGQDCSVLCCAFINKGTQIVSGGTDGVVKVWLIKSGEVVSTLDKHCARVWALAVSIDETIIVSGGADSRILHWKDMTNEVKTAEKKLNQEKVEQEQYLANLLKGNKLLPALKYAISLNRPFKVLKIIESLCEENHEKLRIVIDQLNVDQKETLLNYVAEWNTNSKTSFLSQLVLSFLIDEVTSKKLKISSKQLRGLLAYTNRHYDRMITHLEDIELISYTLNMMKPL